MDPKFHAAVQQALAKRKMRIELRHMLKVLAALALVAVLYLLASH